MPYFPVTEHFNQKVWEYVHHLLRFYQNSTRWLLLVHRSLYVALHIPWQFYHPGIQRPGPWFNINMSSYQYRKSHCGDKTILRPSYTKSHCGDKTILWPSYLHNEISYTRVPILARRYIYIESGPSLIFEVPCCLTKSRRICSVSKAPAGVLVSLSIRISADTMMSGFQFCLYAGLALEGLEWRMWNDFSGDQAALRTLLSVRLSVWTTVTPFSQRSFHRTIVKFSGVITIEQNDVHAKGQRSRSQRSKQISSQFERFQTATPVWIHWWLRNDA